MSQISASLVKELRDRTGAGMMDCKRALEEANGDLEAATRLLREKGMTIFVAILGLGVLVLIHELGHFGVSLALGMRPRRF